MTECKTKDYNLYRIKKTCLQYIPNIVFKCNINKYKLLEVIQFTLTKKSYFNIFGFNKINSEIWGKKFCRNICIFYFTLNIDYYEIDYSIMTINFFIANNKEIDNFINIINNILILNKYK